jgi:TRAP-type C4-dicarboxylate transport system permease small subunit
VSAPARPHPALAAAARAPALVAALALAIMALVTALDVAGRYLLNAPLPGSYELVGLLLAVTVFAALPLATARREHVVVDVLDHVLPRPLVALQAGTTALGAAAALAALAWQLFARGLSLAADNAATNLLEIPLAPFAFFMAVCAALAVPAMLAMAVAAFRGRLAAGVH